MYADFFGLRELPFNNTPDPRFFFSTPDHEEALASLIYAVEARKGFVLLTGEVGAGKTLVSRLMLRHFGARIAFANITHAVPGALDLLESVCTELDIRIPDEPTTTRLVRGLHDFLLARFAEDVPVVLVLDEAQNLPVEGFEQLRMIGNLEADDAKLLQIAIVGQPELQGVFATPELRQLRQRIFRSFHLPALDRALTESYINHRLAVAGARDHALFTSAAIDRVHHHSRGLPRLINALCDNALLSAYSAEKLEVNESIIRAVAEQMMMLDEPAAPVSPSLGAALAAPRSPKPLSSVEATDGGDAGVSAAPARRARGGVGNLGQSEADSSRGEIPLERPVGRVPSNGGVGSRAELHGSVHQEAERLASGGREAVARREAGESAARAPERVESDQALLNTARRELDALKSQLARSNHLTSRAQPNSQPALATASGHVDRDMARWLDEVRSATQRVEAASRDLKVREDDLRNLAQEATKTLRELKCAARMAGGSSEPGGAVASAAPTMRVPTAGLPTVPREARRADYALPGGDAVASTTQLRSLLDRTRDSIAMFKSIYPARVSASPPAHAGVI